MAGINPNTLAGIGSAEEECIRSLNSSRRGLTQYPLPGESGRLRLEQGNSIRYVRAAREQPGSYPSNLIARPRNGRTAKPEGGSPGARLGWKQRLLCVLAMAVSAMPVSAQNDRYSTRFPMGTRPTATVVHNSDVDPDPTADEEKCFPRKLSEVRSTTVDVAKLKVPSQASREYEKACDASHKNEFEEVEQHARSAIDKFQRYSTVWVMLGMILEKQQKAQEARDACSHAATIDATYLPAYLSC